MPVSESLIRFFRNSARPTFSLKTSSQGIEWVPMTVSMWIGKIDGSTARYNLTHAQKASASISRSFPHAGRGAGPGCREDHRYGT